MNYLKMKHFTPAQQSQKRAIFYAILAAALYAVSSPVSKLLLSNVSPTMMAALLYLGAGAGLWMMGRVQKRWGGESKEKPLTRKELPYTVGMVLLDIAAPILLMAGLTLTTAANAALLNNFEIVATSLIALFIFKERISARLWVAIVLVTLASIILSVEDVSSFSFSRGSLLVLLACVCWGLENNCTRKLSSKNPLQIVVVKGFCSGCGSLIIALCLHQHLPALPYLAVALLLGFAAYGLSIYFYIYAQRYLGAAKTSTYYAVAPFIGVALSFLIFWSLPGLTFFIAMAVMAAGTWLASTE